jgi:uroporphyrinogen decarboxylase
MFTAEVDNEILDKFDIDTISATPSISLRDFGEPEVFQDKIWKVAWRKTEAATYSPVDGPFYKEKGTLSDLEAFEWPQPSQLENLSKWKEKALGLRQRTDRAVIARLPLGIVTLTQVLRGFEEWFTDLYFNRKFIESLMDRCAEIWMETSRLIIDGVGDEIDIVVWGDDYGSQNGPMISPEMFRQMVTPRNRKMVESIKAKTKAPVLLHTCGDVSAYLEGFLEMGIDALNPIQVSAKGMDPVKIKAKIGDRIALWGAINIYDLVNGSPKDIKEMVKRRIDQLAKGGGYILSATHNILADVPPVNLVAMLEAAKEYGSY